MPISAPLSTSSRPRLSPIPLDFGKPHAVSIGAEKCWQTISSVLVERLQASAKGKIRPDQVWAHVYVKAAQGDDFMNQFIRAINQDDNNAGRSSEHELPRKLEAALEGLMGRKVVVTGVGTGFELDRITGALTNRRANQIRVGLVLTQASAT